ncbi:hypothetical protein [Bacillus atrophaeus]|uniref:hypothetical protein n=1 Tax=Bacillus atrophaeus TaxID=1452 RepID=UPI0022810BE5|nr:hypothetical protein [Bacillus atrophaeus]MCY8466495.1 hypothetical protein [Bacillus atrophaeus]MCY8478954.1 hypothetical protein [Bacillus atrophaeus]
MLKENITHHLWKTIKEVEKVRDEKADNNKNTDIETGFVSALEFCVEIIGKYAEVSGLSGLERVKRLQRHEEEGASDDEMS